ncbi:hypothetical protein R1sor_001489 [Riccia sorocarpa]|uniref:YDG domain-containing protein n=1 Tax=Riccia sorocarpa TaxID=122646 RepID=A0ABD3GZ80_9MARC
MTDHEPSHLWSYHSEYMDQHRISPSIHKSRSLDMTGVHLSTHIIQDRKKARTSDPVNSHCVLKMSDGEVLESPIVKSEEESAEAKMHGAEEGQDHEIPLAHQSTRRRRIPSIRVRVSNAPISFKVIRGRMGVKGESVILLDAEQMWTHQEPPITICYDLDSETEQDTDPANSPLEMKSDEHSMTYVDAGQEDFSIHPQESQARQKSDSWNTNEVIDEIAAITASDQQTQIILHSNVQPIQDEASSSGVKTDRGQINELNFMEHDARTQVLWLREKFDERRRLYIYEETNRPKVGFLRGAAGQRINYSRGDKDAYMHVEKLVAHYKRDKTVIGQVPGVEIGDYFFYRTEMALIGLHTPHQAGIGWTSTHGKFPGVQYLDPGGNPLKVATSVVWFHGGGRYDNRLEGDTLIYTGHGKDTEDQKMEHGNLALKNSSTLSLNLRVVRRVEVRRGEPQIGGFNQQQDVCSPSGSLFIYDGLYTVDAFYDEIGPRAKKVFKFKLVREQDQRRIPPLLQAFCSSGHASQNFG